MPDALEVLATRRSVPAPNLLPPGPHSSELEQILTVAARVPDHGKLVPWRFVLLDGEKVGAFGAKLAELVAADDPSASPERLAAERARFSAPLVVTVVSRTVEHPKIPAFEQLLSAGAVCMNLENAAAALGFATQWVTGWAAYDPRVAALLGLQPGERVAGFIQVGTPSAHPTDRPRPALADVVTRWEG